VARRMPKSFFWIDQKLIRSGLWMKLTATGKLIYVALSAAADRDGRCHWGRTKLAELAGGTEHDFESGLAELSGHRLVKPADELGFVVEILSLEDDASSIETSRVGFKPKPDAESAPVVVHTHLTVNLGEYAKR
jgi:hypothetical protein